MPNPMEPWGCPECGEGPEDLNVLPDNERSIIAFDMWLEGHVTECAPYIKEQGVDES